MSTSPGSVLERHLIWSCAGPVHAGTASVSSYMSALLYLKTLFPHVLLPSALAVFPPPLPQSSEGRGWRKTSYLGLSVPQAPVKDFFKLN